MRDAFAVIATHPNIGRRVRTDVRRLVLTRFPYLDYHKADEGAETVTVVTVLHAARAKQR